MKIFGFMIIFDLCSKLDLIQHHLDDVEFLAFFYNWCPFSMEDGLDSIGLAVQAWISVRHDPLKSKDL